MIHAVLEAIGEAVKRQEVAFAEPDQLGFGDFDSDLGGGQSELQIRDLRAALERGGYRTGWAPMP